MHRIFQTNSSLDWKEKNWFCKTKIPNQIQIGLEILMTIVKALKIPNQIQFGLENSLNNANALNLEPIPVLIFNMSF